MQEENAIIFWKARCTARPIQTPVLPALGAGFGGVPFYEAARQMAVAYAHSLHPPHRLDWDTVVDRLKAITYDGDRRVTR
jgi:O-acetyl-ADP-ribose deacetylase (regulator of RNase III)